ncbi:BREX-1 system adenine-specific DNA-methyltransferase PglX, partial [Microbacterium sp. CFBP9034]|uniref:BREX-1 system adenine-specific DNA-methyltransferase PglX n=1 Tax=Microbacterium sp. CFBP9034 TaxID=3096540 RepID=UPI002A6B7F89
VRSDVDEFWNAFEHADTFGSLIQPNEQLIAPLKAAVEGVDEFVHGATLASARRAIEQAEYLTQRYSVAIANPPYMGGKNMAPRLSAFARDRFPDSKSDLFAMFIERSGELTKRGGHVAMITMQSWMFLSSFEELRKKLVSATAVRVVAHFGTGAFESIAGAVVSTSAFILAAVEDRDTAGVFIKLDDLPNENSKNAALLETAATADSEIRFELSGGQVAQVPGWTLSYWMSPALLAAFAGGQRLADVADPRQGMATADNGRFLRLWTEVGAARLGLALPSREAAAESGRKWFPYNKGGSFRRWYGNQEYVVNWEDDGRELMAERPKSVIRSPQYYFCESASWSKVGTAEPAFRYFPAGFLFDVAGTSIFAIDHSTLLSALAFGNSVVAREMLRASSTSMNLEVGTIAELPVRVRSSDEIEGIVERLIEIYRTDWNRDERSWDFARLTLFEHPKTTVKQAIESAIAVGEQATSIARELEESLNRQFAVVYGLEESLSPEIPIQNVALSANYLSRFGSAAPDAARHAASVAAVLDLVSYAVGCMLGRYSLDEPGLILADQESTLQDYLAKVPNPSFMPDQDNVIPIVDGDWFEDDIVARFRTFLRVAFGEEHFEENLRFVTESLGVKDVRDYFVKSFYDDHVKRYKKRPIYWLFRSPRGSFNALIYLHRYNPSTASTVLTGYLREFIGKLEANLEHQARVAAGMGGASTRDVATALKEADRIRKVLVELRDYEHDVLFPLAGQQIALDLDNGVLVNYQKLRPALKDIGLTKGANSE